MIKIYSLKKIRGVSLIDALIAMAVGGIGLLALAIFQADLIANSSESRTRAEAVHLAQQQMEKLRNTAVKTDIIKQSASVYVAADVVYDQSTTHQGINSNFTIASVITGHAVGSAYTSTDAQYVTAKVTVGWTNSENIADSVFVASLIAWDNPVSAAARGDVTLPTDLITVGTFAAAPSGGGRMAELGETLLANAYADNNDGTTIYYDANGNYQIVADQLGDGNGLIPIFVSSEPILKLSGTITTSNPSELTILRVLTSDFGFCIYNEDGNTFSGSTGLAYDVTVTGSDDIPDSGDFNCYVAASWHGNVGVINKAGENFCSAAHRYISNCSILESFLYVDATGAGTCPWSGNPSNGLIGQLTEQNFEINNGGCEILAITRPQPSVVGSVLITGNPRPIGVEFSIGGDPFIACTTTLQGLSVETFKCVGIANSQMVVKLLFDGGGSCTTVAIPVELIEVTRDIVDRSCN